MLPDRVSNPGPLTYQSGALPIALRGPAAGSERYLTSFRSPVLNSTLCIEAVGLGGRGGLDGKYVKNRSRQNTDKPNSGIKKYVTRLKRT